MTFPIKKRINPELFVMKKAALNIVDGRIKDEHVVMVAKHCSWLICSYLKVLKYAGIKGQGAAYFKMSLMGM